MSLASTARSDRRADEPQSEASHALPSDAQPLCVDLDGTLVATDLLVETAVGLLRTNPLLLLLLPFWLLRGKAELKRQLARRVPLDPAALPYRDDVVAFLQAERARGRKLVLATAADALLARPVATHLGLFDEVFASDGETNLLGDRKRARLVERFGAGGFDYVGDAPVDLAVWKSARKAYVVAPGAALERAARAQGNVEGVLGARTSLLRAFVKALRPHQWLKNALVFVPLLTAHAWMDGAKLLQASLAFAAFSLCASAVYVANDLVDLPSDRRHRSKRRRPLASGALPLHLGVAAIPFLLAGSLAVALVLPRAFLAVLGLYFVVTNAYTFALKREALLDVLCLAALYTVRIFAGSSATALPVSAWLLALSMFAFLSLALVKRVSELLVAREESAGKLRGRGYAPEDLPVLSQLGAAAGFSAVLVFALYIHSDDVRALYAHPERLWFACPLILYWFSRVWLLTHRGQMHDDPVVFAIRDRMSYAVGLLVAVVALAAL